MKTRAMEMERTGLRGNDIARAAFSGGLSFLLGAASIFGAISPFGVAIVAGMPLRHSFTSAVGAIMGSLLLQGDRSFYILIAILLVFAARFALSRLLHKKIHPVLMSLTAFVASGACISLYGLMNHIAGTDFVLLIIEATLSGSLTYFFSVAGDAVFRRRMPTVFSYTQLASLAILFVSAISALTRFQIFNVNLGVIAGVLSIYLAMAKQGVAGASFASITVAIALNLYSTAMLSFSGMLIIAGFLSGVFSPLKKIGQLTTFITVSTFFLFLTGAPIHLIYRLVEIFLATAVYVLLPERWTNRLFAEGDLVSVETQAPQVNVSAQLAFASETIRDLQEELNEVSGKFREIDYHNISTIYDAAANSVCRGCTKMLTCWDENYSDTVNAFNPISDILRLNGEVTPETLPGYFRDRCCKMEKLCSSVNEFYRGFVGRQNTKRQISESRRIVLEQFQSIADMLIEVSDEISDITGYDVEATKAVSESWAKLERPAEQIICPIDRFGRCRIDIYTSNTVKTSGTILCQSLSDAVGRELDLPTISRIQGKTRLTFFERACYSVDFSAQQCCCGDNTICGDSYEYFSDAKGYAYLLLSDGMGNGKRAAIDSVMTCSILIKLLKAGFGLSSAMKLLNSSMLVKSTDESLSTIDLAKIDLYTGKAEFFKAGAATTFILSKGEIRRFSSGSLPVGILEGVGYEKQSCRLTEGDIVILVSDGALAAGEGWLCEEIRKNSGLSARELAAKLCQKAKEKAEEIQPDDITVIAAKLAS